VVCYGFSEHEDGDTNFLNVVSARSKNILKKILDSTTEPQAAGVRSTFLTSRSTNSEEHNFDMLRAGWQACMDTEAISKAGIKPLSDFVLAINQTWPVSLEDLNTTVSVSDYDGLQKADQFLEWVNVGALHKRCSPVTPDAVNPDPSNSVCCGVPAPSYLFHSCPVLTNMRTESQPRLHFDARAAAERHELLHVRRPGNAEVLHGTHGPGLPADLHQPERGSRRGACRSRGPVRSRHRQD
jgi:hypothetical protein